MHVLGSAQQSSGVTPDFRVLTHGVCHRCFIDLLRLLRSQRYSFPTLSRSVTVCLDPKCIRALEELFDRPIEIYSSEAEDLRPMKIDFDASGVSEDR